MRITLNRNVASRIPNLKIGLIYYNKIIVEQSPQMIKGRMQFYQENLVMELDKNPLNKRATILEWRAVWQQLGADPTRYLPSSERLLQSIAEQNYLTPVQSAVDLNNFFSIMYECPIGIYDANTLQGDLEIALGDSNTFFEGVNNETITLNQLLFSCDSFGPFGSPYVDSLRTAVTERTTDALQVFYLPPSLSVQSANELLQAAAKMFTQVSGGDAAIALLSDQDNSFTFA